MLATPIVCPHGVTTGWDVRDAAPADPLPAVDYCAACTGTPGVALATGQNIGARPTG